MGKAKKWWPHLISSSHACVTQYLTTVTLHDIHHLYSPSEYTSHTHPACIRADLNFLTLIFSTGLCFQPEAENIWLPMILHRTSGYHIDRTFCWFCFPGIFQGLTGRLLSDPLPHRSDGPLLSHRDGRVVVHFVSAVRRVSLHPSVGSGHF